MYHVRCDAREWMHLQMSGAHIVRTNRGEEWTGFERQDEGTEKLTASMCSLVLRSAFASFLYFFASFSYLWMGVRKVGWLVVASCRDSFIFFLHKKTFATIRQHASYLAAAARASLSLAWSASASAIFCNGVGGLPSRHAMWGTATESRRPPHEPRGGCHLGEPSRLLCLAQPPTHTHVNASETSTLVVCGCSFYRLSSCPPGNRRCCCARLIDPLMPSGQLSCVHLRYCNHVDQSDVLLSCGYPL